MKDTDIFWVEVDSDGNLTDFVLLDDNYKNLPKNFNRNLVKVENNIPILNENQFKEYLGFSKKEDGSISKDWAITTLSHEDCLNLWLRGPRSMLLLESDWTQFNDCPLSDVEKASWAEYRQALRDLTDNFSEENPLESRSQISWPRKPGEPAPIDLTLE